MNKKILIIIGIIITLTLVVLVAATTMKEGSLGAVKAIYAETE